GATLVLMPGNPQSPEILFLPKRDPAAETWTGHMYSPEEARKISGVTEIWDATEFEPFMRAVRTRQPFRPQDGALMMSLNSLALATTANSQTPQGSSVGNAAAPATAPSGYEALFAAAAVGDAELYLLMPREAESREFKQEQNFAAQWARTSSGYGVRDAWPIFTEMRLRKSPMELQLLQHAIDITGEALGRSMAVAGRVEWEYEVEAEVEYTFRRRNAFFWGYPSIVGCGPNATTLHYNISQGRLKPGDLLLMDVGAEYGHYTADVTRTFPVSGKFTPEQAEIYNIVFAAQEAAARATRPGATLNDVHNAAAEVIKDGLFKLGLITDKSSNQYRIWFMHGNSHFLGMNVHDVGTRSTKLDVGMTFTNEPGIYIREDALDYLPKTPENEKLIAAVRPAFEKYKNIGVRIEDDMLVTADGVKWMTAAIPRTIPDIEAFIARASREMKMSSLQFERNPFLVLAQFNYRKPLATRISRDSRAHHAGHAH
ncbi:MAG: aminopeptidase P N-terminal domain-containing protein, partial [Pyrinomonadaceae bacterium]|nr:aminopeptidase P N-terminal domain-containing protein [Pyrinomonadaceae bacterium]